MDTATQGQRILPDPSDDGSGARRRIALSDVQNPLLRQGLAIWDRARGARRMPSRAQMTPRLLVGLLRNTALVRAIDQGREFEFRVVGDAVVEAKGFSFQGLTCADIDLRIPGYGSVLRNSYRMIVDTGEPAAYRGWFERTIDMRAYFQESMSLPLGNDGQKVDHLLVMGVYARKHEA